MNMLSETFQHTQTVEQQPGGYEWWYFDAGSDDGQYHFVIIFYRGNPFSLRYISAYENQQGRNPMPYEYPGISISIYEDGKPIYYSFTEFKESDCRLAGVTGLEIGPHSLKIQEKNEGEVYTLSLEEQLPCGDELKADITFERSHCQEGLNEVINTAESHRWNLIQPRAKVQGSIQLALEGMSDRQISFAGTGYHDHNSGNEPMKDKFTDWYWGRFHFQAGTFIYYVMNQTDGEERYHGWLLDPESHEVSVRLDQVELHDQSMSILGLVSARKLQFSSPQAEIQLQQSSMVDNGPFYQRYLSEAFLSLPDENVLETVRGMSEYIRPHRIHNRMFWPMVKMRIRQSFDKPHWVQRSKRLYRWTW